MKTFTLTHSKLFRREGFQNHEYRVVTRSGLHPAEKTLIEMLPDLKNVKNALFLGGRTGAAALILEDMTNSAITVHAYDIHHADTIYRNFITNNTAPLPLYDKSFFLTDAFASRPVSHGKIKIACTSELPPPENEPYTHAFLFLTENAQSTELALNQLDDLAEIMTNGSKIIILGSAIREPFIKQVKARFSKVSFVKTKEIDVITATANDHPKKTKDFSAKFTVSLPQQAPIELTTLPGTFCHRRADNGGLALSEEVLAYFNSEEGRLLSTRIPTIIDMGCGCGMDGILLAKALGETKLIYVDSSSRALASTKQNLASCDLNGKCILSSTGYSQEKAVDLFLANPPYFSDYSIAEQFILNAKVVLKNEGLLFFVAKNTRRPKEIIEFAGFKNLVETYRRGYSIIRAQA